MSDENGCANGVFMPMPLPDDQIFRYRAADDVFGLLYRQPFRAFTVTQLRQTTGHGGKSVDNALTILDSLGLVKRTKDGRNSLVEIDRSRIRKPDDPVLEIPQAQFREPVRDFLDEATESQGSNLVGIVLFGSVARGEADRTSDIDVQVIVEADPVESRRTLHEVRQTVEGRRFDGERYEIQLLVESVDSAENYGEKLQEIFTEGIVLYRTDELDAVTGAVFRQ